MQEYIKNKTNQEMAQIENEANHVKELEKQSNESIAKIEQAHAANTSLGVKAMTNSSSSTVSAASTEAKTTPA